MFPTNHKTMFVLDHTPYFGLSSDNPIDFDVAKSRGPGYVPLPPVCKSLWTCSVEAAVEYCRIVWDLFPEGKLMRFVVSDFAAHVLNTWSLSQQNFTHELASILSEFGRLFRTHSGFLVMNSKHGGLWQNSDIIVVNTASDTMSSSVLIWHCENAVSDFVLPSDWWILETHSLISDQIVQLKLDNGMLLNSLCLVGPVRRGAGGDVVGLCAAIESLGEPTGAQAALPAERLCQNRGRIICITSARDDISIRSLIEIATNTLVLQNKKASEPQPATPDPTSPPIPLAITYCHLIVINVTPETADTRVNSQPLTQLAGGIMEVEVIACRASALANLLGRLVLPHYRLATTTVTGIPMKEEQNATSSANYDVEIIHSAEAHAGLRASQTKAEAEESVVLRWWTPRGAEGGAGGCHGPLWRVTPADAASRPSACLVNFLLNGRSVTLEVPSKKGGGRSASHVLAAQGGELWVGALGGRSPYDDPPALSEGPGGRVTDYRIKEFGALMQQNRLLPLRGSGATARARSRLQRHTTYWPLTISSTLIFNMGAVMEPLTRLVVQESLTDEEVEQCRAVLLSLLGMESRHELPAPHLPAAARGKSSARREEQWRQVWGEVEALVRAHAASPQHRALLRALHVTRTHSAADGDSRATVIKATTDSPLSPVGAGGDVWAPRNVLDALLGAPRPPRRPDFAGRMAAGDRVAALYPQLQQDGDAQH